MIWFLFSFITNQFRNMKEHLSFVVPAILDSNFRKCQLFCSTRFTTDIVCEYLLLKVTIPTNILLQVPGWNLNWISWGRIFPILYWLQSWRGTIPEKRKKGSWSCFSLGKYTIINMIYYDTELHNISIKIYYRMLYSNLYYKSAKKRYIHSD